MKFYLIIYLALASSCNTQPDSPNFDLSTNFEYSQISDSLIVNGVAYPTLRPYNQMYLINDSMYYAYQTSGNSVLTYNLTSGKLTNRMGLIVQSDQCIFIAASGPYGGNIQSVDLTSATDVDSVISNDTYVEVYNNGRSIDACLLLHEYLD